MKHTVVVLFLFLFMCIQFGHSQKKQDQTVIPPRFQKVINSNWTFNYFPDEKSDNGYELPGVDDSKWPAVSIPHTWNTYETTGEVHPLIRSAAETDNSYWRNGWGWYRKHFTINPVASGKKVFIEFKGVRKYCRIWINGNYLGDHKGDCVSFDFDITGFIAKGSDNILAMAVNNSSKGHPMIPPVAEGNLSVYGGIYRDVTLVLKDKLYFPMQGPATNEGGTFVTNPAVSEKEGFVRVHAWVRNDYSETRDCVLNTYIKDAGGKNVQVIKSKAKISPGQLFKFDQTSKSVTNPHLWSPDDPYEYTVRSEILTGNNVADVFTSPLIFNFVRLESGKNNLHVKDEKVLISVENSFHEYPWLGNAIPESLTGMDIWDIAENLNVNIVDSMSGNRITREKVSSGKPAKVSLKSSHLKLNADRGSVAIITADIVDPEGNHVSGATNTIKWSVTGPATLIGHNIYESDLNRHHKMDGVWYLDLPVANLIRSTGEAGSITVLASAPGLASGSVTLGAVEVPADNSIISEPVLKNEGRKRVFRPEMSVQTFEESQGELKSIFSEIHLGKRSEKDYKAEISSIILKNNPSTDTTTTEYKTLVSLFAVHLENNGGMLIAEDYNFNSGHYNNCRIICAYVNPLKLPPLFKDWLKKYYAEEIILRGNEKNSGDEMNWLNWIPSGGTVVISQSDKSPVWPKGTIITAKNDLADLIKAVHPVFAKYSPEAKERALAFIGKMNPYVIISETSEVRDGEKIINLTYTAERSKPILIPLIKFISE